MDGVYDRLSEMIEAAIRTRDVALIRQAIELGRSMGSEEVVFTLLVTEDVLPWPLSIFEALAPSEADALHEARLWLCACAEGILRRETDPDVRRVLSDNIQFARSVLSGALPMPAAPELAARSLASFVKARMDILASASILGHTTRLSDHAKRMLGDDDAVRALAVMGLQDQVARLRSGQPALGRMHRALCQHFWGVLELSAVGEVVGISDSGKLGYLIDMARQADPDALLSALSAFRWTQSAYVLLCLLTDPVTAEVIARQWAADCLARMDDAPAGLLSERSPSLLTIRCVRTARQAAADPANEHAWQQRTLMARVGVLLEGA